MENIAASHKTRRPVCVVIRRLLSLVTMGWIFCSCAFVPDAPPPSTAVSVPSMAVERGKCGDGTCSGPENARNCPSDCFEQPIQSPHALATAVSPNTEIPPLYFFYAIHTHGTEEYLPYDDPMMTQLNPEVAENMLAAIVGIVEVLDRYGVRATWELLAGGAKGICNYQGEDHILRELTARGHEVGTHAHQLVDIDDAYLALRDECGILADTTSGFIAHLSKMNANEAQAAMKISIETSVDLGVTIGTENLSPGGGRNPFGALCANQMGVGNDMWEQSGNLMFPWRPDYIHEDICTDSDEGNMVFVDHVSIEWTILPGQQGPPDVLADEHFDQLRGWFDGALQYMQRERPTRVAVWGFVTHISEYAVGGKGENPPDPAALAALDRFLSYVDSKRAAGLVVYATAKEIADLAFPVR